MSSVGLEDLESAIKSDSVWVPKILVDIPPPVSLDNSIEAVNYASCKGTITSSQQYLPIKETIGSTDIVPHLAPPDEKRLSVLKKLNYPTECVFRFDPFQGVNNKDKLRQYLISQSAMSSATSLTRGSTKKPVSGQFLDSVRLQCVCYRVTRSQPRVFKEGKHQQPGSIKQQEHTASSVKHKSRNSSFQHTELLDGSAPVKCLNKINTPTARTKESSCQFALHLVCHKLDQHWYLRQTGAHGSKSKPYHQNHLPTLVDHHTSSVKNVPDKVQKFIRTCFDSQIRIPQIINLVKKNHGFLLSPAQLYKIRDNFYSPLLEDVEKEPFGSAADKLIAEFKNKSDVSFIYVTHDVKSGFVTYKARRNEDLNQKQRNDIAKQKNVTFVHDVTFVHNVPTGIDVLDIENWRKKLLVGDEQQILVAFAWCHDDELRNITKHPYFLAADMTFSVNKEQRNLYVVGGIDSSNNMFTGMHCFMPSKQTKAYEWVFNAALPHLWTKDVCKRIHCISTDQEFCEYDPIRTLMKPNGMLRNAKHRLDMYHLLCKPWFEKIQPLVVDKKGKKSLEKLNTMLKQVFTYCEDQLEVDALWSHFNTYYHKIKSLLGNAVNLINKVVSSMKKNIDYIAYHKFMFHTTMGFLGSSIVEAYNAVIKLSSICVSTSMNINTSGRTIVNINADRELKKKRKEELNLNRSALWSDSQTKDLLTKYGEGLACVRFDSKDDYHVRLHQKHQWFVMRKVNETEKLKTQKEIESSPIKFDRCRLVTIDNGHMTCTCGNTQQYLMPCRHICAVIREKRYMVSELYNIRWFKTFAYYFLQDYSPELIPTVLPKMTNIFNESKCNHFCKLTGRYKGPYVKNTQFYKDININYQIDHDDIYAFMKAVRTKSITNAVIHNSINQSSIRQVTTGNAITELEVESNTSNDNELQFAVNSQTEIQLSQHRQTMDEYDTDDPELDSAVYQDAKAKFDSVWYACNSDEKIGLMNCISEYFSTLGSKNKGNLKDVQTGGMVFYGSNHTNRRKIGRTMGKAEQMLRKRSRKR